MRDLKGPRGRRPVPDARRPGVDGARIDQIPALLVRLRAAKRRAFHLKGPAIDGRGQDFHGQVGRVERVMAQRRDGVFERREPVHERHRAERRLANRRARKREPEFLRERMSEHRRRLHEEVVRVLMIDQRITVESFPDLEDLAVSLRADGCGIEAQHQVQREAPPSGGVARHPHPPVRRLHLCLATRPTLIVEHQEDRTVLHHLPALGRVIVMHAGVWILCALSGERNRAHREQREDEPPGSPRDRVPPRTHGTMMSCTTQSLWGPDLRV